MKRRDVIRYLGQNGCEFLREGANHTIYVNRAKGKASSVPRHKEINDFLVIKSVVTWRSQQDGITGDEPAAVAAAEACCIGSLARKKRSLGAGITGSSDLPVGITRIEGPSGNCEGMVSTIAGNIALARNKNPIRIDCFSLPHSKSKGYEDSSRSGFNTSSKTSSGCDPRITFNTFTWCKPSDTPIAKPGVPLS